MWAMRSKTLADVEKCVHYFDHARPVRKPGGLSIASEQQTRYVMMTWRVLSAVERFLQQRNNFGLDLLHGGSGFIETLHLVMLGRRLRPGTQFTITIKRTIPR